VPRHTWEKDQPASRRWCQDAVTHVWHSRLPSRRCKGNGVEGSHCGKR
jgi:hypothetical protein